MTTFFAWFLSHWKQIRHWRLIRMLCQPCRLPLRASKWLEGGRSKSFSEADTSSISNLFKALCWSVSGNLRENWPCQIISVSLQEKFWIMVRSLREYYAQCITWDYFFQWKNIEIVTYRWRFRKNPETHNLSADPKKWFICRWLCDMHWLPQKFFKIIKWNLLYL